MIEECYRRYQTQLACSAQSNDMLPPPKKSSKRVLRKRRDQLKAKIAKEFEDGSEE